MGFSREVWIQPFYLFSRIIISTECAHGTHDGLPSRYRVWTVVFASAWIAIIRISRLFLAPRKGITPSIPLSQKCSLVDHRELGSHHRVDLVVTHVGMHLAIQFLFALVRLVSRLHMYACVATHVALHAKRAVASFKGAFERCGVAALATEVMMADTVQMNGYLRRSFVWLRTWIWNKKMHRFNSFSVSDAWVKIGYAQ